MSYIYAGFLSYAHADEMIAARLHRALETYKIPKGHTGTLSPIFRDTTELTAHHSLSEKIQGAVTGSRVLIVLCSPAAKASHWVNEEIRLFRKVHGEAAILSVLAEGTPETAFPPALLEGGREPLAANLGNSKESFRLGVTQIAAAMLGVGLDTLIQRDTKRKRRRLQAVTAGALIFSTVMGATTFSAVTARNEAEANRIQAEDLVEYMITDMYEQLEPVARLDILGSIGERAVEYYDAQDIEKLPDDSLARQARARHILGRVAIDAGAYEKVLKEVRAAERLTQKIYDGNPESTDAIFAHGQSQYWMGEALMYVEDYQTAKSHFEDYAFYSDRLYQIDPTNFEWMMEKGYGANNIALANYKLNNFKSAETSYLEAVGFFEKAIELDPKNLEAELALANVLGGLSQVDVELNLYDEALRFRRKQIEIYKNCLNLHPDNYNCRFVYAQALSRLVTDGLLYSSPIELNETIEKSVAEYELLLEHEPGNVTWENDYYLYLKAFLKTAKDRDNNYAKIDRLEARFNALLLRIKSR